MSQSPVKEALFIRGPIGQLEAQLDVPLDGAADRIAVVCHPHPQYQGTMNNKVVHTLVRAMNDLGMPALRFNFRGVGESAGEYGEGDGEVDDLLAAVGFVRQRWPDSDIWLAGFSFGAVIAARAANRAEARQLVTVAPAVNILGKKLDSKPAMPWLIVQGEADDIVPANEVVDWVAANQPGPELVLLPEVGHFFHGHLVTLRETLLARLQP